MKTADKTKNKLIAMLFAFIAAIALYIGLKNNSAFFHAWAGFYFIGALILKD